MKFFLITLFLSTLFLSGCSFLIGPSTGTIDDEVNFIKGTVVSNSSVPVLNELVVIKKYTIVDGNEVVEKEYRTQTDSSGNFKFTNVDNGYYVLYIGQEEDVWGTFVVGTANAEVDFGNIGTHSIGSYSIIFRITNSGLNNSMPPQAFIPGVVRGELIGDSLFHFNVSRAGFYTIVIDNGVEYFCYLISVNAISDTVYLYDVDLSATSRISAVDIFDFGVNMNHAPIALYDSMQNHLSHLNLVENMVTYYITSYENGLVPYLPGWNKFSVIEINLSSLVSNFSGEVLNNYPMLVRLGRDDFDSEMSYNNFGDLRFFSESYGPMRYKIDSWDEESQTLYVWIIFEQLEISNRTERLFLNYSNSLAFGGGDSTFREEEGFLAVYPLGDSLETQTARDVGGSERDGVLNLSNNPERGIIGNASVFNGGNDNIHLGNWLFPEDQFSVSFWYQWFGENNRHQVLISRRSLWLGGHMQWQIHFERYGFRTVILYNTNYALPFTYNSDDVLSSDWVYLSFSYNNGVVCLYVNGELASGCHEFFPDLGVDSDIRIGNSDIDEAWNGLIDEVRFHRNSRSAAWFALDYETQRINQTVVDVMKIH